MRNWIHTVGYSLFDSLRSVFPWVLAICFMVVCLDGVRKLEYSADTRVFLGGQTAEYSDLQEFEDEFGRRTTFHYSLEYSGSLISDTPPWKLLGELEDSIWRLDYVRSVVSAASAQNIDQTKDGLAVELLSDLPSGVDLEVALSKRSVDGILVTSDRKVWSVVAELDVPVGVPGKIVEMNTQLSNIATEIEARYPGAIVEYTGEIALMAEFAASAERDNLLLMPVVFLTMLAILAVSIRSWRLFLTLVVLLLSSVAGALALQGWFGAPVNSATAVIPLIVLVVVAANAMHLFWAILYRGVEGSSTGHDHLGQIRKEYSLPVAVSGLTTAAGFWLLMRASSPPFAEIGWIVGSTLIFSTFAILYWVPWAILSFRTSSLGVGSTAVSRFASYTFLIGRERSVFLVALSISLVSLMGLSNLRVSDDFSSYFPADSTFGQGVLALERTFGGPDYLEIVQYMGDNDSGELLVPQVEAAALLAKWLRSQPEVRGVVSLSDSIQEISEALGYGRKSNFEETLLVYEMGLPVGRELTTQVSQDRSKIRTTAMLAGVDSTDILNLRSRIEEWASRGKFSHHVELTVTGISVPTSRMAMSNTLDVLWSVLLATLGVSLLLCFLYRSFRIAALVLLSMLLPIGIGFGVWGWLYQEVGLATAAILAATIGIVVDDVVHVVHRFMKSWSVDETNATATLIRIMKEVAPPILMSSVAIVVGFGLLSVSDFGVNQTLGISISLIVFCALCVVFFLLPRLISLCFRVR